MIKTLYKFRDYKVSPDTEILIIGTFNPDIEKNKIDFFYSRHRNHLWRLLPEIFAEPSLKDSATGDKKKFIEYHKIDFTDLISCVTHQDEMSNYSDIFLEDQSLEWNETAQLISSLKKLKLVLFTRKTFAKVPKLKARFYEIQSECDRLGINSKFVVTPARKYTVEKLEEWKTAFGRR